MFSEASVVFPTIWKLNALKESYKYPPKIKDDWSYKEHISYTNLKSSTYKAYHSGDITSAPQGASEFIDIDMKSVIKHGGRYVVMLLLSYTSQNFINLPEVYSGWMIRKAPNSGEIYEPKTVQDKFDIASETRISIPLILDLVDRQVIWGDLALKSSPTFNNLENNLCGISLMGKSIVSLKKTNLHELFSLHIKAREGELVENRDAADLIFSVEDGITPFDSEKIMAEFI